MGHTVLVRDMGGSPDKTTASARSFRIAFDVAYPVYIAGATGLVVRHTVHRNRSAETRVIDYTHPNGRRFRITETTAI